MEPNPLPKTKRLRKINRNRNSRPGYYGSPYHHFPPAAAAIIDTNNNVLVLPQPQPLPLFPGIYPPPPSSVAYGSSPQNVEQLLSGSNDSERASYSVDPSANWMSALGQYLLRAINCAAMAGETIPHPADLHQSNEPREETSKNVVAQFRCEVCEIDFSSKNILFEHILGNQHKEYVAKLKSGIGLLASNSTPLLLEPSTPAVTASSPPSLATSTPLTVLTPPFAIIGPQELPSVIVSSSPAFATSTPFPASTSTSIKKPFGWCEVCKILCTNKNNIHLHFLGKKHKKNLEKSKSTSTAPLSSHPSPTLPEPSPTVIASTPPPSASCTSTQLPISASIPADDAVITTPEEPLNVVASFSPIISSSTPLPVTTKASTDGKITVPHVRCEICDIFCHKTVLDQHLLRKRHKKNLGKTKSASIGHVIANPPPILPVSASASTDNLVTGLQGSLPVITSLPPASIGKPIIRAEENLKKSKVFISAKSLKRVAACAKDLEAKRRRVLESGTAAKDVRVCNICDVVAPSDVVYRSHLFGQKHVARIKKLASTGGSRAI